MLGSICQVIFDRTQSRCDHQLNQGLPIVYLEMSINGGTSRWMVYFHEKWMTTGVPPMTIDKLHHHHIIQMDRCVIRHEKLISGKISKNKSPFESPWVMAILEFTKGHGWSGWSGIKIPWQVNLNGTWILCSKQFLGHISWYFDFIPQNLSHLGLKIGVPQNPMGS